MVIFFRLSHRSSKLSSQCQELSSHIFILIGILLVEIIPSHGFDSGRKHLTCEILDLTLKYGAELQTRTRGDASRF